MTDVDLSARTFLPLLAFLLLLASTTLATIFSGQDERGPVEPTAALNLTAPVILPAGWSLGTSETDCGSNLPF